MDKNNPNFSFDNSETSTNQLPEVVDYESLEFEKPHHRAFSLPEHQPHAAGGFVFGTAHNSNFNFEFSAQPNEQPPADAGRAAQAPATPLGRQIRNPSPPSKRLAAADNTSIDVGIRADGRNGAAIQADSKKKKKDVREQSGGMAAHGETLTALKTLGTKAAQRNASKPNQLDIELIAMCASCVHWSPGKIIDFKLLENLVCKLYMRLLHENDHITGKILPDSEKQAWVDELIPPAGLISMFVDKVLPIYDNDCTKFLEVHHTRRRGAPFDAQPEPHLRLTKGSLKKATFVVSMPPDLLLIAQELVTQSKDSDPRFESKFAQVAANQNPVWTDPYASQSASSSKYVPPNPPSHEQTMHNPYKSNQQYADPSTAATNPFAARSEFPFVPSHVMAEAAAASTSKPMYSDSPFLIQMPSNSPAAMEAQARTQARAIANAWQSQTPVTNAPIISSSSKPTHDQNASADATMSSIIVVSLHVHCTPQKMDTMANIVAHASSLFTQLSAWVFERCGLELVPPKPGYQLFDFFNVFETPAVVIQDHVWVLTYGSSSQSNGDIIGMKKMPEASKSLRDSAVVIHQAWVDFARYLTQRDGPSANVPQQRQTKLPPASVGAAVSEYHGSSGSALSPNAIKELLDPHQHTSVVPTKIRYCDGEFAHDLAKYCNDILTRSDINRAPFLNKIQRILNKEYRNVFVYLFGSSVTGLGNAASDVDMVVDVSGDSPQTNPIWSMYHLASVLKRYDMKEVQPVARARVPICKFYDPEYRISADINVGHLLGLYNSSLIKSYVSLDPRVKPLIMLVKQWAKQRDLNNPSGGHTISSYAYSLMVIAFLQKRGILPSLQAIASTSNRTMISVPITMDRGSSNRSKLGKRNAKEIPMRRIDITYANDMNAPVLRSVIARGSALEYYDSSGNAFWKGPDGIAQLFYEFMYYYGYEHVYRENVRVSVRLGGVVELNDNAVIANLLADEDDEDDDMDDDDDEQDDADSPEKSSAEDVRGDVVVEDLGIDGVDAAEAIANKVGLLSIDPSPTNKDAAKNSAKSQHKPQTKSTNASATVPSTGIPYGLFVEDPFEENHSCTRMVRPALHVLVPEFRRSVDIIHAGGSRALPILFAKTNQPNLNALSGKHDKRRDQSSNRYGKKENFKQKHQK